MTRRRCLDCLDGHCRHTGYVPAGMILAACRRLDCDPQPIQARLFSHATKLLVGGAGQPDTSLCAACEYRRYLAAAGGRDLANENAPAGASRPSPGPSCARTWLRRRHCG
jgi:hypothetical protein